jgi:hypothetical protein
MSAANAGYSTTTGSFSSYGYGRSAAHGTYQATTYNAYNAQLAQQAASAQTNAEIATMQAEGERNLQALNQTILKDHTVLPGEWYGGTIVMERPPRPDQEVAQYNLSIRFGGEVHEFQIRQAAPQ